MLPLAACLALTALRFSGLLSEFRQALILGATFNEIKGNESPLGSLPISSSGQSAIDQ